MNQFCLCSTSRAEWKPGIKLPNVRKNTEVMSDACKLEARYTSLVNELFHITRLKNIMETSPGSYDYTTMNIIEQVTTNRNQYQVII